MDREKALRIIWDRCQHSKETEEALEVLKEERPRGEWIEVPKYKGYYVCSECLKMLDGDFERFEHWEMRKDNFCNVCGSDNRKKEGE